MVRGIQEHDFDSVFAFLRVFTEIVPPALEDVPVLLNEPNKKDNVSSDNGTT